MKTIGAAVDSWASSRLDVFGIGVGNAMFHKSWAAGTWDPSQADWESVGGIFTSPPTVVSWGPNRLDVFGIGADNAVYHKSWAAGAWDPSLTGWESIGGTLTSPPAVVSWGPNRLDVFVIGTDNAMYHKTWDDSGAWSPSQTGWFSLGGAFTSPPAVVSWGLGRFDIFGIGADGTMYHKAYSDAGWSPSQTGWNGLGGSFTSPPAAVSWGPNRLDVFGIGTDGAMYHKNWAEGAWGPSQTEWEPLGGGFVSLPAAVSWAANRLDVFGIGTDNTVYHKAWTGNGWDPSQSGWESLGGTFLSAPAVVSWGPNRLDVFGIGSDNAMFHKSWAAGAWAPSLTGWESLGGTFTLPVVQLPDPVGGMASNNNYFLEDGGKPLTGVVVTLKFDQDFVSTNNGYSFQLNCYSTEGPDITTEWQQYVIWTGGGLDGLTARIDTWSGRAVADELNRIDASLFSAAVPMIIKAGYSMTIALTYLPGSYDVSGANYSVADENGLVFGTASIAIIGQNLRTTGNAATVANLAPIAAMQFNIGGDYNKAVAALTGGAGSIIYSAENFLNVVNREPKYTDLDDGTGETANLTFGKLPGVTYSRVVTQSFQATPGVPAPRMVLRRGRALPPPDSLSFGGHPTPK